MAKAEDERGTTPATLATLAEHLGRIALDLAEEADRAAAQAAPNPVAPPHPAKLAALIDSRRRRGALLGLDLTHTGWTLLLELYRARRAGEVLRVSEAGRNTGLHPAVLYRRLNALAAAGLATRARDTSSPGPGTVVLVALTPKAEAALDTWFADAAAAAGWPLL